MKTAIVAALILIVPGGAIAALPGEALFNQRCSACHAVADGAPAGIGPNLRGVVGRKPGSTPYAYSPALKRLSAPWSAATLDRFLTGPSAVAAGTKMPIAVADPKQRAQIIDYLTSLGH